MKCQINNTIIVTVGPQAVVSIWSEACTTTSDLQGKRMSCLMYNLIQPQIWM